MLKKAYIFFVVILLTTLLSCTNYTRTIAGGSFCNCEEEDVWQLIIESKEFQKILSQRGAIVLDNAYSFNSNTQAYREYFKCPFYEYVLMARKQENFDLEVAQMYWAIGQTISKHWNVRNPVKSISVVDKIEGVYFYDLRSLANSTLYHELPKNHGKFFLYGPPIAEDTDIISVVLDSDSDRSYFFTVDCSTCKIVSSFEDFYDRMICSPGGWSGDWIEVINFDMSLDSFYQAHYNDLIYTIDSLGGPSK